MTDNGPCVCSICTRRRLLRTGFVVVRAPTVTAPPASPSAPHSPDLASEPPESGPAEISRPEAVQAPYTTPEKPLPKGLVWCWFCGAVKQPHQHEGEP